MTSAMKSGAGSGIRRELSSLLDSQLQNPSPGSRTRSGKSPVVLSPPKAKKARKTRDLGESGGGGGDRVGSVWVLGLCAVGSGGFDTKTVSSGSRVGFFGGSAGKSGVVDKVDSFGGDRNLKPDGCLAKDMVVSDSVAEVKVNSFGGGNCGLKSDVDMVVDEQTGVGGLEGINGDLSSLETPVKLKVLGGSAAKTRMVGNGCSVEDRSGVAEGKVNSFGGDHNLKSDGLVVVDTIEDEQTSMVSPETPPLMGDQEVLLGGRTVKTHAVANGCLVEDGIGVDSVSTAEVKVDRIGGDSILNSGVLDTVEGVKVNGDLSLSETQVRMDSQDVGKVANGLQEKGSSRFKKAPLLNRELRSLIMSSAFENGHGSSSVDTSSLPSRRVTRSAVKITVVPQEVTSTVDIPCLENGHESCKASNVDNFNYEESSRRTTRGMIKGVAEHSRTECKPTASKESNGRLYADKGTPGPLRRSNDNARLSGAGSVTDLSDSASKKLSSSKKSIVGKLTRKDVGLHKLVFMNDILPEGTEVGYYIRGKKVLEGYIKDSGIYCCCCNSVVSPSQFEAHSGHAHRKKPYNNIYTSNGVSLHELSVSLSKDRRLPTSETDDLCSICADGGDLLLCDLCPRAFHKECVNLSKIPTGDWQCQYCINLHQRDRCVAFNDNAKAAGRIDGVDPIEQIFKRCIRIVTISDTSVGGCTFCRLHDFSKSRFSDRTVIICDQCEKEYHVGCLREHKMADLKELPEGEWFCCTECNRIQTGLAELLHCGPQSLPDSDVDLIKKKCATKGVSGGSYDISWRLVMGKKASEESKLLLSGAVSLFHECFDPIVEPTSGRDLIPTMVYGRTIKDQDFAGMYSAVLTIGSSVISVGILRVLGCEVAELPLVATSREHQGLGYFQSLFSCIERLLSSLNVKHLVLPSAQEAESIWTNKFGFTKITADQLEEYLKGARITIFHGTSILHKPISLS